MEMLQRHRVAGAGILLAVLTGACVQPPGGNPGGDDLQVQVTSVSSSCDNDGCTGAITIRVTNNTDDPTTEAPDVTVVPDSGTANRVDDESSCDDGPLDAGDSCTERYTLETDDDSLTGDITVDAGNLQGGTSYSA